MTTPLFSVLITAYNRAAEIPACVESVRGQSVEDLEIVVVDDASSDATVATLDAIADPRLRIVSHRHNRGIMAARATAIHAARGHWLVMLDSDWELVPGALARLAEAIDALPDGVRIIRSRMRMDDGTVSPSVIPSGVTGYEERLDWLEATALEGGPTDAGYCVRREVYEHVELYEGRGAFETAWETDLARRERSLWLADVLGLQHLGAVNSTTRGTDTGRMRLDAAPCLEQVERMLSEHGGGLRRRAPVYHALLLERAALEALLAGRRATGLRLTVTAWRAGNRRAMPWAVLVLGLVGPRPLARAKAASRGQRQPGAQADG